MPKKVDLADRVEFDIELDIVTPAGALPAEAGARRDVDPVRDAPEGEAPRRPPGRLADGNEAAARLAGIVVPAGAAEDVARLVAEGERAGLTHELTDAEAARLAARATARVPVPAEGPPPVYLPAPERVEVPNLPALLGRQVANAQGRDVDAHPERGPVVPMWFTLYQAPNYLRQMIRAIGDHTLGCFPCYDHHRQEARAAGEDPLGSVRFLANMGGRPNRKEELDHVAAWISANGAVVDHTQLTFPVALPGYEPRVILAAVGDISYLLVEESVERGSHANAQYIYAWKGGMDYYLRHGIGVDRARDLTRERPVELIAGGRQQVVARRPAALLAAAPAPAPLVGERVDLNERRRARKDAVDRLPVAPSSGPVASDLVRTLRLQGFLPYGTPTGPALRKALDDGEIQVTPEKGHSLANSPTLNARRLDASGNVLMEMSYEGGDDLVGQMEPTGPRPF